MNYGPTHFRDCTVMRSSKTIQRKASCSCRLLYNPSFSPAREFSFSEKYIFGRFDAFCTRLRNLLSMFKKINLYTHLFEERMEALLPEEALEDDHKTFDSAVRVLTLRDYDYLDFRNEAFDKVKKLQIVALSTV